MKHLSYDDLDREDSKEFASIIWPRIIGAGLLVWGALAFIDLLMSVESEKIKTGIVMLLLFTLCFGVCLRLAAKK